MPNKNELLDKLRADIEFLMYKETHSWYDHRNDCVRYDVSFDSIAQQLLAAYNIQAKPGKEIEKS